MVETISAAYADDPAELERVQVALKSMEAVCSDPVVVQLANVSAFLKCFTAPNSPGDANCDF